MSETLSDHATYLWVCKCGRRLVSNNRIFRKLVETNKHSKGTQCCICGNDAAPSTVQAQVADTFNWLVHYKLLAFPPAGYDNHNCRCLCQCKRCNHISTITLRDAIREWGCDFKNCKIMSRCGPRSEPYFSRTATSTFGKSESSEASDSLTDIEIEDDATTPSSRCDTPYFFEQDLLPPARKLLLPPPEFGSRGPDALTTVVPPKDSARKAQEKEEEMLAREMYNMYLSAGRPQPCTESMMHGAHGGAGY